MKQENLSYKDFFKTAFGREPYEYQVQIASEGVLPSVVNAPTGAGKTAAILGAWLWRRIKENNLNKEQRVGRRLIYCLPMRVLVEQTAEVAQKAVENLENQQIVEKERFKVHVLMGGETADEWDSNPEREYIIVGTQDMLLSRALNRGYAMSRYRWPVHFGLLNNDCLWVFDEVQLMGSGLATSVQLQAFRRLFGAFGPVKTLWMSATIDRDWLKTADCDLDQDVQEVRSLNLDRESSETIHEVMCARKELRPAEVKAQDTEKLAEKVLESHKAGSRTLVIVNTVQRAIKLYQALKKKIEAEEHSVPTGNTPELVLIHSRFRPCERKKRIERLLKELKEGGTIIVSTQVVEAGVDVSAQTLFTELAPWSSLVQRFGRCNRRGEYEQAEIFWIDVKDVDAAPYDPEDLKRAREHLKALEGKDTGPEGLARYIEGLGEKRKELLTFEHVYVIRPHDLHGLFSTEPDLAGGFTDVSNFVRNIEREADVYVYWREFKDKPAENEPLPRRDELCPVRFSGLKGFLGKSGVAWMWNAEERAWKALRADKIKPGMTLLLSASQGGYDPELGWTGKSGDKPDVIEDETSSNALMINAQESLDDDQLSERDWVSLPDHLKDAEAEAKEIVSAITFDDDEIWKQCYPNVIRAAWWHDVGKALRRWQQSGRDQLLQIKEKSYEFLKKNPNGPEADFVRGFLEKLKELESDGTFWAKFPGLERELKLSGLPIDAQKRIKKTIAAPFLPGLRHEAASALAAWQKWRKGADDWTALAVYLVACHHGKVRTVLRSTQKRRKAAAAQTQNPTYTAEQREDEIAKEIFGITSEDALPKLDGWLEKDTSLDLRLGVFGAVGKWNGDFFEFEEPSWVQMVAELLGPEIPGESVAKDAIPEKEPRELGPFRLAFLEALIRAADVKASQVPGRLKRDQDSKFKIIPCEGVRPDNLGGYFVGLGLLSALTKKWPTVRGCWRNGCFCIVGDLSLSKEDIEAFLLGNWNAPQYERWWSDPQKADTKAKSDRKIWEHRSKEKVHKILHLDAHIVGVGRNQFNPVFGTGGNIGKRDLATACEKAKELILNDKTKKKAQDWLKYTLWAEGKPELPELSSTGTWFVFANKTFNSGQDWSEEGKISPWSFLLALEGALLLVGSVNRRLSSISRPYAVFPFVTDRPSPRTEGEIGLTLAEFWAPLWEYPATLLEIHALLERGLTRVGNRDCRTPHEFALAARAAGVDAGVKEFARFVFKQTTSSQVYEAIPQEHIEVSPVVSIESELIEPLLPWLDRLPYEPSDSKQRGKFKGLRGPIEEAIVKIAERPDDTERWQQLLLLLANVQTRIDRNQSLRESCKAVPRLSPLWFDKAWPEPPTEIRIARAIASIGTNTDMPILCNVFGVHIDKKGNPFFPTERPQSAVWHHGDVVRVLADVLERRLVDTKPTEELPLAASYFCNAVEVEALLEGALDWEMIGRWIPPLSLIRWSRPEEQDTNNRSLNEHVADGHYLLSALFRPFFCPRRIELAGKELFPERLKPKSLIARRLLNLICQGELGEAIKLCESRYLAANFPIVAPSLLEIQRHDAIAASLLVPINVRDIVSGLRRWLQPEKSEEV